MAIVKTLSNQFRASATPAKTLDPLDTDGRRRRKTISVANLSTDNTGSTYKLCELPSDCILDPSTQFYVSNWGYADIRIGTLSAPGALVSQLKSAGNTITPITAGDPAKHGKRLWEILGLAADPGGTIPLYAHAIANATGAGSMLAQVDYMIR